MDDVFQFYREKKLQEKSIAPVSLCLVIIQKDWEKESRNEEEKRRGKHVSHGKLAVDVFKFLCKKTSAMTHTQLVQN